MIAGVAKLSSRRIPPESCLTAGATGAALEEAPSVIVTSLFANAETWCNTLAQHAWRAPGRLNRMIAVQYTLYLLFGLVLRFCLLQFRPFPHAALVSSSPVQSANCRLEHRQQ